MHEPLSGAQVFTDKNILINTIMKEAAIPAVHLSSKPSHTTPNKTYLSNRLYDPAAVRKPKSS